LQSSWSCTATWWQLAFAGITLIRGIMRRRRGAGGLVQ
jgi:hypothetical protein